MCYKIEKSELSNQLKEDLIFNSEKITRFVDVEIEGRTLKNLLGRAGNPIYQQKDLLSNIDNLTFKKDSIIVEAKDNVFPMLKYPNLEAGKYYIGLMDVKVNSEWSAKVQFSDLSDWGKGDKFSSTYNIGSWTTVYNAAYIEDIDNEHSCVFFQFGWFDDGIHEIKNIRLYEITKEEYDKINVDYSEDKVGQIYPYVDDIRCIVNPYIEHVENLINIDNWAIGNYEVDGSYNSFGQGVSVAIDNCSAGTYSLKIEGEYANYPLEFYICTGDDYENEDKIVGNEYTHTFKNGGSLIVRFNKEDDSLNYESLILKSLLSGMTTVSVVKGDTPKSYSKCNNSRISFNTKLYGGEYIRKRNHSYIKNSIWNEIEILSLDLDNAEVAIGDNTHAIIVDRGTVIDDNCEAVMVRFDGGYILNKKDADFSFEHFYVDSSTHSKSNLVIVIPNNLTGWGGKYKPTPEEIKAFFLGWRLSPMDENGNGLLGELYTDLSHTTRKQWSKIWCGIGDKVDSGTLVPVVANSTLNAYPNLKNDGFIPYRIIYKKEKENIQEIEFNGSVMISDIANVKIGSGLMHNQEIRPLINDGKNYAGGREGLTPNLKHRIHKILKIYDKSGNVLPFVNIPFSNIALGMILCGNCQAIYESINNMDICDYLLYQLETVTSFNFKLNVQDTVKKTLEKAIEEIHEIENRLSDYRNSSSTDLDLLKSSINPNILINSDFRNPINQRGKDVYTEVSKYTIDRWRLMSSSATTPPTLTINKGYISLTGVENQNSYLYQTIDKDFIKNMQDESMTLSIRYRNNSSNAFRLAMGGNFDLRLQPSDKWRCISVTSKAKDINTLIIQNWDGVKFVDGTIDVEWVKLELGERATYLVPKDYFEELRVCRRFYQKIDYVLPVSILRPTDSSYPISEMIYFRDSMRVIPKVTLYSNSDTRGKVFCKFASANSLNDTEVEAIVENRGKDGFNIVIQSNEGNVGNTGMVFLKYEADAEIY